MAKYTSKRARIVKITFNDHCQATGHEAGPIECEVFGILFKETKDAYFVASWVAHKSIDHNTDSYCILKVKGTKVKTLGFY